MASWKENPVVGIVAGIVFVIAMVVMVSMLTRQPTIPAELKARMPAVPANTPLAK